MKKTCKNIEIQLDGGIMPTRGSRYAAAYDLYCPRDTIVTYGRQVVDLCFRMDLGRGLAAVIQPRSGFASKGVEVMRYGVLGEPSSYRLDADVEIGLVDEDYRGHVGVILKVNECSSSVFVIPKGTRIAQMRIVEVPVTELCEVEELDMSNDRGGGFGHTGSR